MNVSKLKPTDWMVVAGGVIVLIFGLLKWFSWDLKNDEVIAGSGKSNAFDYLFTGVVPWLLVVGAGLITLLLATGALNPGKIPWPLVMLGATAVGTILIIIRLIMGPDVDTGEGFSADSSRGIGIWISAVGALLATVGAFLSYQAISFEANTTLPGARPSASPRPDREIPPPAP